MNLLLELARLRLNRHNDTTAWATAIRDHLAAGGGKPSNPRRTVDPMTCDGDGELTVHHYSLLGT
jgi:hypothetical protein